MVRGEENKWGLVWGSEKTSVSSMCWDEIKKWNKMNLTTRGLMMNRRRCGRSSERSLPRKSYSGWIGRGGCRSIRGTMEKGSWDMSNEWILTITDGRSEVLSSPRQTNKLKLVSRLYYLIIYELFMNNLLIQYEIRNYHKSVFSTLQKGISLYFFFWFLL